MTIARERRGPRSVLVGAGLMRGRLNAGSTYGGFVAAVVEEGVAVQENAVAVASRQDRSPGRLLFFLFGIGVGTRTRRDLVLHVLNATIDDVGTVVDAAGRGPTDTPAHRFLVGSSNDGVIPAGGGTTGCDRTLAERGFARTAA